MKRVALFAVVLGLGLLVAPGLAQNAGVGDSVAEEIDPVGSADAHDNRLDCLIKDKGMCTGYCYFDEDGTYHCHYD